MNLANGHDFDTFLQAFMLLVSVWPSGFKPHGFVAPKPKLQTPKQMGVSDMRGTLFWCPVFRILLFRVLYWGPLFLDIPKLLLMLETIGA